jgi:predicted GIY-YIG superfamily endonuclease|tara:strand:+ start:635 stop:1045 length:411 start_codon:yes stop_codon:yes gene_type:complete
MDKWSCYIIENRGYTYVGVSNNVHKRLRAHNKEISGGAKYTTSKGKGWKHICIVHGFPTKIESLQFEWALKHVPPRNAGGVKNRIKKLNILLNKEYWTSRAPLAETMPLTIEWIDDTYRNLNANLPVYIEEVDNHV